MLLLPLAIRVTRSVRVVGMLLTCMGLFQGPLMPARSMLMRDWLPNGPRRAIGTRVIGLGATLSDSFTPGVTVLLASRLGYSSVGYGFGGFTALICAAWHCLATDRPSAAALDGNDDTPSPSSSPAPAAAVASKAAVVADDEEEDEEEEEEEEEEPVAVKKVAEWRIFTVPAVLACVAAKVSWGVSENRSFVLFFWKNDHFTKTGSGQTQGNLQKRRWPFSFSQVHWFIFQQWTPIYMMEELGACKKLFSLPSPS
jgi:MFS family permease